MDAAFRSVARGLRLAAFGFLLTCWGAGSAFVLAWVLSSSSYYDDELRLMLMILIWSAISAGVVGVIIGFVGRIRCMKMPEEYPSVRGRAVVAIVLEGSGWGSIFVGVGVIIAMGYNLLPRAEWVPTIGMGMAGLMLFGGRIMFLRFLRLLASVVDDDATGRRAKWSLALFLIDWGLALLGAGAAAGCSALGLYQFSKLSAYFIWIVAGMSGAAGLVVYDRLLNTLSRSVTASVEANRDDEAEPTDRRRRRFDDDDEREDDAQPAPTEEHDE